LGCHAAKPASLVRPRHGIPGFYAHGQGVLPPCISASTGAELGGGRVSFASYLITKLHRVPLAVGPVVLLGHYGGGQHHFFDAVRGREASFLPVGRPHGECQCAAAFLCAAHHDLSARRHHAHRRPPLASPLHTPNPAKAPWYFTGLQELLHYFPPFVAGIILPVLIVSGLFIIPFV